MSVTGRSAPKLFEARPLGEGEFEFSRRRPGSECSPGTSPLPSAGVSEHRAETSALVVGLDLGTGGARALVVSAAGEVRSRGEAPLAGAGASGGRHEQDAESWWTAGRSALASALAALSQEERMEVRAISVDGTSGTVVGLDALGQPVGPALMYNDGRAQAEARELSALEGAPPIAASFSLAKMLWLARHEPRGFARTECFAHQADLLLTQLSGVRRVSDWSNALKSGFDATTQDWGGWLDAHTELRARLPRVVAPGSAVGRLLPAVAAELGLSSEVQVVAGCTDGTAGFLASGAGAVGEDNTTLGTTLVFKRVAAQRVEDPAGALYCHALPGGLWLPGAASNVGADWIRQEYPGADLGRLDRAAEELLPVAALAYPSCARGERFPFQSASAQGFGPQPRGGVERYAANLQGTAFVERLAYEVLDEVTGRRAEGPVFCTGGGSRSDVWTQLRADVTGRVLHRPACSESALGVALLAAVGAGLAADLASAGRQMVRVESTFRPEPARQRALEPLYRQFRAELLRRGYLNPTEA